MNVLDTFYILFKSNTAEVKQANQSAQEGAGAFAASMEHVDQVVEKFGEHFGEVFTYVGERLAAVLAFEELAHFTTEQAEANEQLGLMAERLNINVEDLAAYDAAIVRGGGHTGEFTQTLDFMQRGLADLAVKGTSRLKPFFDELRVRTLAAPGHVRPVIDIMNDLGDRLAKMDKQTAAGIEERFGFTPGVALFFQKMRQEREDAIQHEKELGVVNKEQTEIAARYEEAVKDLSQRFHYYATLVGSEVLPILTRFFDWLGEASEYLGRHGKLVEGFFIGIGLAISTVYYPQMIRAVAATAALIGEWLLIPLAIALVGAAVGLAWDDIQHFMNGQKSLIGELSAKWPEFGKEVRAAVKSMGDIFAWVVDYWKGLTSIAVGLFRVLVFGARDLAVGAGKYFKQFTDYLSNEFPEIKTIIDAIGALFDWLGEKIAFVVKHIPKILLNWGGDLNKLGDVLQGKTTWQKYQDDDRSATLDKMRAQGWDVPDMHKTLSIANNQLTHVDLTPYNAGQIPSPVAESRTANNSTVHNWTIESGAVQITAPPGASADDIGDMFDRKFSDHLSQALNHFDDGVKS